MALTVKPISSSKAGVCLTTGDNTMIPSVFKNSQRVLLREDTVTSGSHFISKHRQDPRVYAKVLFNRTLEERVLHTGQLAGIESKTSSRPPPASCPAVLLMWMSVLIVIE